MDRYIIEEAIRNSPLHLNQHVYMPYRYTETALRSLITKTEGSLSHVLTTMGISLNIEEAFNNATSESMIQTLRKQEGDAIVTKWITNTLSVRTAIEELKDDVQKIHVKQGCPQGGVLSTLLPAN